MPLPGVLRRVSKALPSIFQAIAIVAIIHMVGQVSDQTHSTGTSQLSIT
jgi:hypothetical protein